MLLFFCKQKTAYEMRISDWSSDVCSSDLGREQRSGGVIAQRRRSSGDLMQAGAIEAAIGKPAVNRCDAERQHQPSRGLGASELGTEHGYLLGMAPIGEGNGG